MKQSLLFVTACSLGLFACSRNPEAEPSSAATTPVETSAPNASYQPAFSGQTRISGVTTAAGSYRATVLTTALASPWGLASLPDGRLLITEKAGTLRLVKGPARYRFVLAIATL